MKTFSLRANPINLEKQPDHREQETAQCLELLVLEIESPAEGSASRLVSLAGDKAPDLRSVACVVGENVAQVLLFKLYNRQIDQHKYRGKQEGKQQAA